MLPVIFLHQKRKLFFLIIDLKNTLKWSKKTAVSSFIFQILGGRLSLADIVARLGPIIILELKKCIHEKTINDIETHLLRYEKLWAFKLSLPSTCPHEQQTTHKRIITNTKGIIFVVSERETFFFAATFSANRMIHLWISKSGIFWEKQSIIFIWS